jgi:hypothetical protein
MRSGTSCAGLCVSAHALTPLASTPFRCAGFLTPGRPAAFEVFRHECRDGRERDKASPRAALSASNRQVGALLDRNPAWSQPAKFVPIDEMIRPRPPSDQEASTRSRVAHVRVEPQHAEIVL